MNNEPQNVECRMSNGNACGRHLLILHPAFDILRFKRAFIRPIDFFYLSSKYPTLLGRYPALPEDI